MQEQWEACSAAIKGRMPEQAYRTWIKPLTLIEFNTDELLIRLGAPSQIKADIVRNQYLALIEQVVRDEIDPAIRVEIGVHRSKAPPQNAPIPAAQPMPAPLASGQTAHTSAGGDTGSPGRGRGAAALSSARGGASAPAHGELTARGHAAPAAGPAPHANRGSGAGVGTAPAMSASEEAELAMDEEEAGPEDDTAASGGAFASLGNRAPDERTRLNPGLVFSTFVTGKANDLARAAALQAADRPGTAYNPLYIQGGVGLGKTHLMQAVGNAIHEREPNAAIRYVTANQFFQEMVSAVRRETVDQFQRYYRSLDVLLIDDIQFLSEKKRSQEEFFFIFESLTANNRQIVVTSDSYPKELDKIDDRLISRLNSGLTVPIEPPELEMRVAILLRKAEQVRVRLPEDVAYFIGKNIRQNVRELEGALQRVIHYSKFRSMPITLDLVKEALKDILSYNRGQISIDLIQRTVADYYKIKLADMYSKRKPAKIALPRQIAMYLAKELTQKSLPEIGEAFGGKDHTTVLYAVRKITELRAHKSELNTQIHVLDQTLREYL